MSSVISKEQGLLSSKIRLSSIAAAVIIASASLNLYAQSESNQDPEVLEEVLVTGSRIQRSGFETSTPVNVVDQKLIEESGYANIYDVLKSVPSIGVGLGSANASPGALSNPEAGASFVNLRGLGVDRSLVLVDGLRRVSGSSQSSAVDVSMIPAGLIERVETITGGASAVYGADAVSGVVNIIMKDEMEGVEMSISSGASTEGSGGERIGFDLAGGTGFDDDRGSLVFGVSYSKEDELRATQRDFSSRQVFVTNNPDNTGPDDGIPDTINLDDSAIWIFATTGAFNLGGQWYTADPDVRLIDTGVPYGIYGVGGEGFRQVDFSRLRQEQETIATRASLNYELFDGINFFFDADYGQTTTVGSAQPDNTTGGGGYTINSLQRDNPLIPADLAASMDANGLTTLGFLRAYTNWGNRTPTFDRTSFSFAAGFEGTLQNDWDWSVSFQDSRYENNSKWSNYAITENLANAIDVIADPVTGEPVCRSGAAGCVPIYPLSQEPMSAEQDAYIRHTALRFHRNEQRVAAASLAGNLMDLPAGALQFAAGLEHREEEIKSMDDGLARQGALHLFRGQEPQNAEMSVKEAYLELVVPVIAEMPFIQQLDIEAAVRSSDYDTIGSTTASKIGLNWAISDDLRIRASSSISVRAPNLSELFSPGVTTGAFLIDPCDITQINLGTSSRAANCAALGIPVGWANPNAANAKQLITGGNPDLTEEESDSFTFGLVITPDAIKGLSLSIDYWDIEITDAIGSFGASDIIKKCVDSPSLANNFCPMITRDGQLSIERINVSRINVGRLNASGIDFGGAYGFDIAGGDLSINLNGSFLMEHEELIDGSDPTSLFINRNDPNNPKLRSNLNLTYQQGPLSLGLNTRYIGSTIYDPNALTDETSDKPLVPSRVYNDLIIGYEFENELRITGTITNIGDVNPPRIGDLFLGVRGNYDNTGRFISLRASYSF
ncbi:TonB-dependent receptor [Porticoccaceae bacterium]|nr:TonB-dependent receptor [Porticoccaceae bacterium]MDA8940937.1 TonB-dependent receptor [Porticoccaceae bacterium]